MLPLVFYQWCHLLLCFCYPHFHILAIHWRYLDSRSGTHMDLSFLYCWGTSPSKRERSLSIVSSQLPVSVQTDSSVTTLKQSLSLYANICRNIFTIFLTLPSEASKTVCSSSFSPLFYPAVKSFLCVGKNKIMNYAKTLPLALISSFFPKASFKTEDGNGNQILEKMKLPLLWKDVLESHQDIYAGEEQVILL